MNTPKTHPNQSSTSTDASGNVVTHKTTVTETAPVSAPIALTPEQAAQKAKEDRDAKAAQAEKNRL